MFDHVDIETPFQPLLASETGTAEPEQKAELRIAPLEARETSLLIPTGLNDSYNQLVLQSNEAVYRYDPEAVVSIPKRKRRKPSRSRLGVLAPSPKLRIPPRSPLVERANKPSPPPIPQRRPAPFPPVNQAIRPRAELRMGQPSLDARMHSFRRPGGAVGLAGLGSFIPPPPPS
ncbi:hypothetical protein FRC07_013821, partial [Ceratobasidium sp. 392]